jgi:hypothetical protein
MGAFSDYVENKLIDWFFRGQSFTPPATQYIALMTAAATDAGGGTEVSGGSYARVAVTSSESQWAGTQGAGTTVASTGTGATTSNNGAITYPAPSANWGTILGMASYDAPTGGNLLWYAPLSTSKTVNSGDVAPSFGAAALTFQLDT